MFKRIAILSIAGLSFALADGSEEYKSACRSIMIDSLENLIENIMIGKLKNFNIEGVLRSEVKFDRTGLVIGDMKYFIRIWKHPDKRFFNMPNPLLPSVRKKIFAYPGEGSK
jgi:hypothetical protein